MATVTASATPVRADTRPHVDAGTDPGGATVHVIEGSVTGGAGGGRNGSADGCTFRYVATTALVYKFPQARFDAPRDSARALRLPPGVRPLLRRHLHRHGVGDPAGRGRSNRSCVRAGVARARRVPARHDRSASGAAVSPGSRAGSGSTAPTAHRSLCRAPTSASRSTSRFASSASTGASATAPTSVHAGLGSGVPEALRRSRTHSRRRACAVTAAFRFVARYRIDGGEWIDLGPVPRTVDRVYDVVEIRSLLVR